MTLVRWNPRREMTVFENHFNRFLNEPFFRLERTGENLKQNGLNPEVDIYEENGKIVINADLPGIEKKDISIDLHDRVLTIKGERLAEAEVEGKNYYRQERVYGSFQRSFSLAEDVVSEQIEAEFKDGVLKIEIPKPVKEEPKKITIQ